MSGSRGRKYFLKKEQEKEQKEKEKIERKLLREQKRNLRESIIQNKTANKRQKKKHQISESSSDSSEELVMIIESEGEGDNWDSHGVDETENMTETDSVLVEVNSIGIGTYMICSTL